MQGSYAPNTDKQTLYTKKCRSLLVAGHPPGEPMLTRSTLQ